MKTCSINNKGASLKEKIKFEVADVFRNNIDKLENISYEKWKAVNAIISCRTEKMGYHVLTCDNVECGHEEYSYNSCRNRHCPKCQSSKKLVWLESRINELLPIDYYHIVFTIPDIYNPIALQNKKIVYDIMFKAVKETLLEAAQNPKNLGAEIGFITILHTWGQNLLDHPHIHCIVTGGGLNKDKNKWIHAKKNFFITVKILSKLFRGKFLDYLKKAYKTKKLEFHGRIRKYTNNNEFQLIIDKGYNAYWNVYSKKPFANPEQILKYLGKYTHRIAIGNSRIVNITDNNVMFKWKDYKDDNKTKIMPLDIKEFMKRFLLHILPKRFVRIRFYGILSNKTKKEKLNICLTILTKKPREEKENKTWQELLLVETGIDVTLCPLCNKGKLIKTYSSYPAKSYTNGYKFDSS